MYIEHKKRMLNVKETRFLTNEKFENEVMISTKALVLEKAERAICLYLMENAELIRTVTINGRRYISGVIEDLEDGDYETVYEVKLQHLEGIVRTLKKKCPKTMSYSEGFTGVQSESIYNILNEICYMKEPKELIVYVLGFFLKTENDFIARWKV